MRCAREAYFLGCSCVLFIMKGWVLVSSLVLHGVAPSGHLITSDNAAWRWVASSLVCALAHCVPLVVEPLSGA